MLDRGLAAPTQFGQSVFDAKTGRAWNLKYQRLRGLCVEFVQTCSILQALSPGWNTTLKLVWFFL